MTTTYPTTLPKPVPADRWQWEQIPMQQEFTVMALVAAGSPEEAEQRCLSVIDYDFQDDLCGAVAESSATADLSGRYLVMVRLVGD
jgi:hypothetical protein